MIFFPYVNIGIVTLSFVVVTPVEGFINAPKVVGVPNNRWYQRLPITQLNEKECPERFAAAKFGVRRHHSNRQYHSFSSRTSRATFRILSERGKMHRKSSSTRSSQLFSSSAPIESSLGRKTTAVYLLILASLLSFVGDNIFNLSVFRKFYLYHRKWQWWQPITSTFCHGDKSHLTGNVFLLLLFGRSVEDELGPVGLLFSYIFCGVVANLVSLAMLPKNTVSLGASGAVFGLFSVSIFSRLSLGDILDWRKIIEVGVLGQFVVERFLNEAKTAAVGGIVGVNHVAHLAGAGAGIAMILILRILIRMMEK